MYTKTCPLIAPFSDPASLSCDEWLLNKTWHPQRRQQSRGYACLKTEVVYIALHVLVIILKTYVGLFCFVFPPQEVMGALEAYPAASCKAG